MRPRETGLNQTLSKIRVFSRSAFIDNDRAAVWETHQLSRTVRLHSFWKRKPPPYVLNMAYNSIAVIVCLIQSSLPPHILSVAFVVSLYVMQHKRSLNLIKRFTCIHGFLTHKKRKRHNVYAFPSHIIRINATYWLFLTAYYSVSQYFIAIK